jgi:hypothetical protein
MYVNQKSLTDMTQLGGLGCLMPMVLGNEVFTYETPEEMIRKFQNQIGGTIVKPPQNAVVPRKHDIIKYK